MGTLRFEEKQLLDKAASSYDILGATIARLYEAKPNPRVFTYTGMLGAIALLRSPTDGQCFLKLVSVSDGRILWEQTIGRDIKYVQDKPYFHSFMGSSCVIGLSFADEGEANQFFERYSQKDQFVVRPAAQPIVQQPSVQQSTIVKSPSQDSITKKTRKESAAGFFGFGKTKKEEKKGSKIDKTMISAPSNFEHVSHVGYNPNTGYSAQNIPMEWKIIFQKAGITEEQLQDKKTAKTVAKFMKQHAGQLSAGDTAVTNTSGPPPPPPATRRAPPPPPPSRGTAGRAPPPPPPSRSINQSEFIASPPVPQRSVPSVPSYPSRAETSAPPPPPPIPSQQQSRPPQMSSSGGPPPPPPPPMGGPPPPPPVPSTSRPVPSVPQPASSLPAASDSRGDLLSSIRQGHKLKSAAERTETPRSAQPGSGKTAQPPADTSDDLANALRNALSNRLNAIAGSGNNYCFISSFF